jgi:hypothetical protein
MPAAQLPVFEPPDTIAALPLLPFEFSPAAAREADVILGQQPDALFRRLLRDQESEAVLLVARRILDAFGSQTRCVLPASAGAGAIAAEVARARAEVVAIAGSLAGADADARDAVLRQRAPLSLIGGCWLDVVSQPATQPSVIVNRLLADHYVLRGQGNPHRSAHWRRRLALQQAGVYLPEITATDFLAKAGARPLTALHGCCYLALSRLPASFLPELVGVHYVVLALAVDDLLLGTEPVLAEPALRETLAAYLELAGPAERERLQAGIGLALALEREHVAMLADLAGWQQGLSLESKVAAIVARHAPYAGNQHKQTRVGGQPLARTFTDPDLDVAGFLREFRESGHLRRTPDGLSRFTKAIKLGGPMFGIFSESEAAVFAAWVASVQAGERPDVVVTPNTVGDHRAAELSAAIAASAPGDVVIADPGTPDDRELFYRLINIEHFANTLPLARQRAARLFADAEILFTHGAAGRYTDASYFEYSPRALYERAERVYWDKLIAPYQPLEEIPDADEVVFLQTTYALGALIDAAWLHRTASTGRSQRRCDAALFSIYADEMGFGDLRKNHITLIHRALNSMGIHLPHIRDAAFRRQGDLPDELYGFSLQQLCMALHPDTCYNEILGYNLAIEMFGLGELRLHEVQKLRHHGFDDCYEAAHLTIDNISAGHSKQAANIIVAYLDEVASTLGEAAVDREWRRIWRGYASLAYFVEHALLKEISTGGAVPTETPSDASDSVSMLI